MKYGFYIGKKYINIYNFNSKKYVLFGNKEYMDTPFGIYEEINSMLFLDKLTIFLLNFEKLIEKDSYIIIGLDVLKNENLVIFRNAFQKAGFYKNVLSAKQKMSFISTKDKHLNHNDFYNGRIIESFEYEEKVVLSFVTNHSYGIYDAESDNVYEVVPCKTKFDDLIFNKKACNNYRYYVDVEQVNNDYNRVIFTICEDNKERLYFEYENKRLSGRYRLYFYVIDDFMCIDVFDIIRREWLSSDEKQIERQFKMKK